METWREMCNRLNLDDGSASAEIVRRATSRARHLWRVDATIEAAMDYCGRDDDRDRDIAVMELLLDLHGVGGEYDAGGVSCKTDRRPWAKALGKGRKNASDGPAWTAAAEGALAILTNGEKLVLMVEWDDDIARPVLVIGNRVPVALDDDGDGRWVAAISRAALLIAAGAIRESRWFAVAGTVSDWAAVVDECERLRTMWRGNVAVEMVS